LRFTAPLVIAVSIFFQCARAQNLTTPEEKHIANLRQLTFGGENAEAYFSGDDQMLILQSTRDSLGCDQIFVMEISSGKTTMVSNGLGRTTCSFFNPVTGNIIYSSTFLADTLCPPTPSMAQGYVWALYPGYDIFSALPDGSKMTRVTIQPGYDAEAVISPDGKKIAFTSTRDGDLEIYIMNDDGSDVVRVTNHPGYDGGAFFSPDSKKLVFRAQVFKSDKELQNYRDLLKQNLVRPSSLEIFTINIDGAERIRLTDNGAANFAPFFHPAGQKIVFSSNLGDPRGREFDIYMIDIDGGNLERITFSPEFDGFPMFSYDGKKLVFASNRNNDKPNETNIFIADWID
jgi:Tol biopolymer transport system component